MASPSSDGLSSIGIPMKKLLAIPWIVLCGTHGSAQSYQPFPSADAVWRERSSGFQCSCCADFQYAITGDTTINSLIYHKLHKTGVRYLEDQMGNCTQDVLMPIDQYAGCFRNDPIQRKVYFMPASGQQETLLYDFNLTVGDTVPATLLNGYGTTTNVVSGIDSVLLDGVYHKRFTLDSNSCWTPLQYIEGVGSTYGLLAWSACPFERQDELLCFIQSGSTVYPSGNMTCELATGVSGVLPVTPISVFPNPSLGKVGIRSEVTAYTLAVFDPTGQRILDEQVRTVFHEVDLTGLPKGLYLLRFSLDGDALHTERLIRQ